MAILLTSTACSQAKPDDAVTSFLDHLIAGEYESAAAFFEGDITETFEFDTSSDKTAELILAKVSYNIKSSTVDGDTAIVSTEIIAPNLAVIVGQVMSAALPMAFATAFSEGENSNQEAMDQFVEETLTSLLSDPNVPMTTTTVDIHLQKVEKEWKIQPNDDLANAITGGAMKAFENFNFE
jgi:hypothetical protein